MMSLIENFHESVERVTITNLMRSISVHRHIMPIQVGMQNKTIDDTADYEYQVEVNVG